MSAPTTAVSAKTKQTLNFSCHCNAIKVSVPRDPPPTYINECMCSSCRKRGAAWIYYAVDTVTITKNGPTKTYRWGDKTCDFTWCDNCGCCVYWHPLENSSFRDAQGRQNIGINSRIVDDLEDLKYVERRVTWSDATTVSEGVYDENGPVRN